MNKRKNDRRRRRRNPVLLVLTIILSTVFVVSMSKLVLELLEYERAKAEYDALAKLVVAEPKAEVIPEEAIEEPVPEETEEKPFSWRFLADWAPEEMWGFYPGLEISHDELKEINPDYLGIITIPALDLVYPMVQGEDNDHYLHVTFEGSKISSGCIFVDCRHRADFTDYNTLIYGHNMRNMTMFGSLKRFIQNTELCDTDPYIYIYTCARHMPPRTDAEDAESPGEGENPEDAESPGEGETAENAGSFSGGETRPEDELPAQGEEIYVPEAVRRYRIFGYYVTGGYSDAYMEVKNKEYYDAFVDSILRVSNYESGRDAVDFSEYPRLITLSTCHGASGSGQYFVVHAALEELIPTGPETEDTGEEDQE